MTDQPTTDDVAAELQRDWGTVYAGLICVCGRITEEKKGQPTDYVRGMLEATRMMLADQGFGYKEAQQMIGADIAKYRAAYKRKKAE